MLTHSDKLAEELKQGHETARSQSAGNHSVTLLGSRVVVHVLDVVGIDIRHVESVAIVVDDIVFHSRFTRALLLTQGRWGWLMN